LFTHRLAIGIGLIGLSACTAVDHTRKVEDLPVYQQERFNINSPYSKDFAAEPADVCEAAKQSLLSQGFLVAIDKLTMTARKFIQPGHGLEVDVAMSVVCATDFAHPGHTQLYVTAWEDHMVTKRNANAASLGVGALGAISLPVNAAEDALIKVGVKMIPDPTFYERFYALVETIYAARIQPPNTR
jgi:hypothetical protein